MSFSEQNCEQEIINNLMKWIESETGLCFPEVHHDTIIKAAYLHSKKYGIDICAYQDLLRCDSHERNIFFNDIMIGETYFFRDERQFSVLISSVLPELFRQKKDLKLWSATCASGEEAISLIAVLTYLKEILHSDITFSLLASDINQESLDFLREGKYSLSSFRNDGKKLHSLLDNCGKIEKNEWQVSCDALSHISVKHMNILSDPLPQPDSLDIIFFRNTLVYMKAAPKEKAIERIVDTLKPGGYLFLASPEVPTVRHPFLEVCEVNDTFFFKKLTERTQETKPAEKRIKSQSIQDAPRDRFDKKSHPPVSTTMDSSIKKSRSAATEFISTSDVQKGLSIASIWTRQPELKSNYSQDLPSVRIGHLIIQFFSAIEKNNYKQAHSCLDQFESLARENYISLYLRGLVKKNQQQIAESQELFEKARLYNPDFWPALFHAAISYEKLNPERSISLLNECIQVMQNEKDNNQYHILLEGFDASYFQRMAEKLLVRIKNRK